MVIRGLVAAACIAGLGLSAEAQTAPPTETTAPTRSTTGNPATAPTVSPAGRPTQNPYVNPSAAGTQLGRPNLAPPSAPRTPSGVALKPNVKNPISQTEARRRLEAQGYREISGLRLDGNGIWQGVATKGRRQVHVGLDAFGDIAELR